MVYFDFSSHNPRYGSSSTDTIDSDSSMMTPIWENFSFVFCVNVLLGVVLYCYYQTVYVDAGVVPYQFKVNESEKEGTRERTRQGKYRFCTHCNHFKPDRAHHCRKCNRCFLKMDHHCPWSNSCIGYYNYKYYMLLLFWGFVSLAFVLVTQFWVVYETYYKTDKTWTDTWVLCNYLWTIVMEFSVCSLGLFHCGICIKNLTTLEWMEKRRVDQNFVNIYDIDPASNWNQVFGSNPLLWIFPSRFGIEGDGINFPLRTANEWLRGVSQDFA